MIFIHTHWLLARRSLFSRLIAYNIFFNAEVAIRLRQLADSGDEPARHAPLAGVVELADTYGSGPYTERFEGSSPSSGTFDSLYSLSAST